MHRPIEAIILALVCAVVSAALAALWIRRRNRARLALAQADMLSYALGAGAVVSLTPEVLQAFAPELVAPGSLIAAGLQNLDYAAYVLAPIGAGVGFARRWQTIQLERSLIANPPLATTA